jgi:hypothetical protein
MKAIAGERNGDDKMKTIRRILPIHQRTIIFLLSSCAMCLVAAADRDGFVDHFDVPKENFASVGRNDYCVVEPGWVMVLEGKEEGENARLVVTVLDATKTIDGVETRVIEERETVKGQLSEVSRNFVAVDKTTRDVYYFGEETDTYKDGKIVDHEGSWQAGKDGAHFGLLLPAKPKVGQKFYQEIAPKVAMDRVEVQSVTDTVQVSTGNFDKCLKTEETSPLEPDSKEHKFYAPGVGLLIDGDLKLVRCGSIGK